MSAAEWSQVPAVQTVAWALLHSLWQGALVALGLAGALVLLRRAGAGARHAVALAALIALPVLPALTAWQSEVGAAMGGDRAAALVRGGSPEPGARPGEEEAGETRLAPMDSPSEAALGAPASRRLSSTALEAAAPPSLITRFRAAAEPYLPVLVVLWLAGVLGLSLVHFGGLRRVRQVRRAARPAAEPWQAALVRLSRRLGLRRPVALLESAAVAVPAVIGWLRPVLLLPASTLTGLSPQQVEALIAHELAHVRRGDLAVNLLQAAIETLLFYHPAAWWVSRVVREEREHCCDDLAVLACGDRLVYARALADLEGLRAAGLPAAAAIGADSGSLLARIRRLLAPSVARRGEAWWGRGLAGLLGLGLCAAAAAALPLFAPIEIQLASAGALAGGVARASSASDAPAPRQAEERNRGEVRSGRSGVSSGAWTLERQEDGDLHLGMKMEWRGGRSHNSFDIEPGELEGLATGPDVRFTLRRDAGAFRFAGRFDGQNGGGTFTFEPDPGYARELAGLGWSGAEGRQLELALHDLSLAFAREIRDLGYGSEPLDRLVEFRIHGVSPEFVRGLAGVGLRELPAERLVEFRIHGVSPEAVRELAAAGYEELDPERLVEFRIHGVSPEFVRGLAEVGLRDLPAERLVEFRIHGMSPEFVREMAGAGYSGLTPEQLVDMRIHGIDAAFVREAAERGFRNLPADELIELKIHGFRQYGR